MSLKGCLIYLVILFVFILYVGLMFFGGFLLVFVRGEVGELGLLYTYLVFEVYFFTFFIW